MRLARKVLSTVLITGMSFGNFIIPINYAVAETNNITTLSEIGSGSTTGSAITVTTGSAITYEIDNPYETVNWSTFSQYKADFHSHSVESDGGNQPGAMIEDHYTKGFDIMALTDHNVTNTTWDRTDPIKPGSVYLTPTRLVEIAAGTDRNNRGMTAIPNSNEQSRTDHINTFWAPFNNESGATMESTIAKTQELGGISHINHAGRYTGGAGKTDETGEAASNNPTTIAKYVNLFDKYASCVGMEIINKKDGDSASDRILWDNILKQMMPNRPVWGFSNDDTHSIAATGFSYNMMLMPENTEANVRSSMEDGTFYAVALVSKRELGTSFVATGPAPKITDIVVDEQEDSITIQGENYSTVEWIADGQIIATGNAIDLTDYEDKVSTYIRAQLKGDGGISFTQPFGIIDPQAESVLAEATLTADADTISADATTGIKLNLIAKDNLGDDMSLTSATVEYKTDKSGIIAIAADGTVTVQTKPITDQTVKIWAEVTNGAKTVLSNQVTIAVTVPFDYEIKNPYATVDWSTFGQYKADFHAHSVESDGADQPALMIEEHYTKGFDILAMTDHNVTNTTWDRTDPIKPGSIYLTPARLVEIAAGTDRNNRGMTAIPNSNEQSISDHVNTFWASFNNASGATLESSIAKAQELGGISHINHPGRYTGGAGKTDATGEAASSNPTTIAKYVNLFDKYDSCVGMEIINKKDGDSASDRILWDNILKQTMPNRPVWGFSNDDTHALANTGFSYNMMLMPENTEANVRSSMEDGTFYAVALVSKRELGSSFVATGPVPKITNIAVDEQEDSITIQGENYSAIEWIADGKIIATGNAIDLNDYEDKVSTYIRAQLKGNGGISFTQPFGLVNPQAEPALAEVTLTANADTISAGATAGIKLNLTGKDDSGVAISLANATVAYKTDQSGILAIATDGTVTIQNKPVHNQAVNIWAEVTDGAKTVTSNKISLAVTLPEFEKADSYIVSRVKTGLDDVEEYLNGDLYSDSSDLEITWENPTSITDKGEQLIGTRFTDLAIPKGAKILDAYMQFSVDEAKSADPFNVKIQAEAVPNSTAFAEALHNLSSRVKTNNSINWKDIPQWTVEHESGPNEQTPNLAALVQEIVDMDGWNEGNAMSFILSGTGNRTAESFEGAGSNLDQVPTLHVAYIAQESNQIGQPTIDCEKQIVEVGGEATATLSAKEAKNLYGFDLSLKYDSELFEYVSVTPKTEFDLGEAGVVHDDSGNIRIVGVLKGASTGIDGDIDLVTVKLKAKDKDALSTLTLLSSSAFSDGNLEVCTLDNDVVKKIAVANSDVTKNSELQINDLVMVAKLFGAEQSVVGSGYETAIDMNKDGIIDIEDIAYVAKMLLGR